MAVSNLNFSAQIDAWTAKTVQRTEAVFREATQRTVSIAQDIIPVDTGFARASVRASLQEMPPINPSANKPKGGSFPYNMGEITLTIAEAKLGQTIFVGWTANYVGYLENGSSKQAPSGFVRLAAAQWPQTVSGVIADAKASVG